MTHTAPRTDRCGGSYELPETVVPPREHWVLEAAAHSLTSDLVPREEDYQRLVADAEAIRLLETPMGLFRGNTSASGLSFHYIRTDEPGAIAISAHWDGDGERPCWMDLCSPYDPYDRS